MRCRGGQCSAALAGESSRRCEEWQLNCTARPAAAGARPFNISQLLITSHRISTCNSSLAGADRCVSFYCWQGVHADGVDGDGTAALMYAAIAGHTACVRALIEGGAKVDCIDPAGVTPLMLAAGRGHGEVCQVLLEGGAQLTVKAVSGVYVGQSALDVAVAAFEPAVAALLLSWAEAHPVDGDIMTPDPLVAEVDNLLDTAQLGDEGISAAPLTDMVMSAGATAGVV